MPKKRRYGKLTRRCVETISMLGRNEKPFRKNLNAWIKQQGRGVEVSEISFSFIKSGRSTPWSQIEEYVKYWSVCQFVPKALQNWTVEQCIEEVDGPERRPASGERADENYSALTAGWEKVKDRIMGGLLPSEESSCIDEDDVHEASEAIGRSLGRRNHPDVTDNDELEHRGYESVGHTRKSHFDLFYKFWWNNRGSLLFATLPWQGHNIRVGVVGCVPLAESAYMRLRSGSNGVEALTGDDILPTSNFLMKIGWGEMPEAFPEPQTDISIAMMRSLMFQTATMCEPLRFPMPTVRFMGYAVAPEIEAGFRAHGYKDTGAFLPGRQIKIMELRPPERWSETKDYAKMCSVIAFYQLMISAERFANKFTDAD